MVQFDGECFRASVQSPEGSASQEVYICMRYDHRWLNGQGVEISFDGESGNMRTDIDTKSGTSLIICQVKSSPAVAQLSLTRKKCPSDTLIWLRK